ncbi:MAG: right-handed parallel beta-helix repeat-containing protein [Pseudonocardia sp.]|nr:right-handed parallel beta-helix repeat-containing protein [Pseudonocardia sp.]
MGSGRGFPDRPRAGQRPGDTANTRVSAHGEPTYAQARPGRPPGPAPTQPLYQPRPWLPPPTTPPPTVPGGHDRPPRRRRWPMLGLAAAVLLALVGGVLIATSSDTSGPPAASSGGTPNGQPEAQANCTTTASDSASARDALNSARAGARICLSGDLSDGELEVHSSGTANSPVTILGGGSATTGQITVKADHVVVDGVRMSKPRSPGFLLEGNDITVRNSLVDSPQVVQKGDDGDGIRFFGNDIKIVHNVIRKTVNINGQKGNHADAIQTFATGDDYVPSQRVLIDGNRFEDVDNMCVIAEGPDSDAGDGSGDGKSSQFTITNNYCDNRAGQAFSFDDISQVTLTGNTVAGKTDKAFSLANKSVRATIKDNKIGPKVGFEVGMDDSSERGYNGPEPGGDP